MGVQLKSGGNLDRESIVDAAVAIVESEGLEKLTIRALARACSASPMAIYGHLATKEELLRAVAIRYLERVEIPQESGESWRETILHAVGAMIEAFDRWPFLHAIILAQHLDAPPNIRAFDLIIGALRRAGLGDRDLLVGLAVISSYATGYAQRRAEARQSAEPEDARRARIATLDAAEFPNVAAFADAYVRLDADQDYAEGLSVILDGLALRAA